MANITPFVPSGEFTMEEFNKRLNEINTTVYNKQEAGEEFYNKTYMDENFYDKIQTLTNETKKLLGLTNSATPDEAFAKVKALVDGANANANGRAKAVFGTYYGNITASRTTQCPFKPQVMLVTDTTHFAAAFRGASQTFMLYCNGGDFQRPYRTDHNCSFSENSVTLSGSGDYLYDAAFNSDRSYFYCILG